MRSETVFPLWSSPHRDVTERAVKISTIPHSLTLPADQKLLYIKRFLQWHRKECPIKKAAKTKIFSRAKDIKYEEIVLRI